MLHRRQQINQLQAKQAAKKLHRRQQINQLQAKQAAKRLHKRLQTTSCKRSKQRKIKRKKEAKTGSNQKVILGCYLWFIVKGT